MPAPIRRYLELVRGFDPANDTALRTYPGSPCIARAFLRPEDHAALCDIEPARSDSCSPASSTATGASAFTAAMVSNRWRRSCHRARSADWC